MNKKYWLRGGIIGAAAFVVVYVVFIAFNARFLCEFNSHQNVHCSSTDVLVTFLRLINPFEHGFGLIIPLFLVIGFGIGCLVGWIYGKIKKP